MAVGFIVHQALITHPDILDKIKYVQAAVQSSVELSIAAVLGLANYLVSKASYNTANLGQTASLSPVIDDDALVCHVDPAAGIFGATAGKTFVWQPGGGAGQIGRYRADDRDADVLKHKEQWDQKATATDLGYLFLDVV